MPETTVYQPPEIEHLSILDEDGELDEALEPDIPDEDLVELYRTMVFVRAFDERRLRMQRQGRIGTFAPVKGQEAAQLGSIYALRETDWFVPAFRETAAAIWRGMKPEDDLLYTAGYEEGIDIPEGARDMPIAIPVASQIPHAVGIAWASRYRGEDDVTIVYFGDGATSEGDFHEAMNFAGVWQVPVVFLNQNNHYAISLPREEQTRSQTLAQKADAYGFPGVQVDGNDILAVYAATRDAVDRARRGDGPTLIEAVTYRLEVHTTADDPKKYRDEEEVERWRKRDPIPRFRKYLMAKGLMTEEDRASWQEEAEQEVRGAVERFERMLGPDPLDMFDHAYAERPPHLDEQRRELEEILEVRGSRSEAEPGETPGPEDDEPGSTTAQDDDAGNREAASDTGSERTGSDETGSAHADSTGRDNADSTGPDNGDGTGPVADGTETDAADGTAKEAA